MRRALTSEQASRGKRLGHLLKRARRDANVSVGPLSVEAGVAVDTIKSIEGGRSRAPTFWVVADIAQALDLDLGALARDARESEGAER